MSTRFGGDGDRNFQVLWEDGERVFCRAWHHDADGSRHAVLAVLPAAEHPTAATLERLAHEYGLKDALDGSWATRPLELVRDRGQTILLLEASGREPLDRLLGAPMEIGRFLSLAIGIAVALGKVHQAGLVHKDVKPANILVNRAGGEVRLTGFGIASRLPRERQAPEPPETIAGTLAYLAPEQTGRMNRSIDSRSDLYAIGVVFYQMLTGSLPFTASNPIEWVHCHIARKPVPPAERLAKIPTAISQIIMKLLAKTAEERYQTASGVARDLRRCLADWEISGRIDDFPLGEQDIPDRLLIPETLYGRKREVESLISAFDRIVESGVPELVLISGYSGIGKSAVVNELHKALVPARGLFASGKFDQYKRDIPYATLAQAFQGLIRPLLGLSDAVLAEWRDALVEALGPNAKLMVDLVPELKLITGEPAPVPELPPQHAQSRFQSVFRRFLGVFARPEHPLALFLDDLQWLDPATLDLMADMLIQPEARHLLLIGAYRDNEVRADHPLLRRLEMIRQAGARLQEISLAPLALADLQQLILHALRCLPEEATLLAQLVHEKTSGNPFFTIQFLHVLADEGLLRFDYDSGHWQWDLARIHAKGYTDNVVDLLAGKLTRLPTATQTALQSLACLGNAADIAMLCLVRDSSEEAVHAELSEAVRQELIVRADGVYRFVHDRVQEAAYALIPADLRAAAHLRIGRLLAAHTPPEQQEEAIFEIVNQLNRGAALIIAPEEREQLAAFNLIAGRRAKASTAYASALIYLVAGVALLAEDRWERRHELMFALELERAECEFVTGAMAASEARLDGLATRAVSLPDLATVTRLRLELFTAIGRLERAFEVGVAYLERVGIAWPAQPTQEEVRQEYALMWRQLGERPIEALIDLPRPADPLAHKTMEILTALVVPAWYLGPNLRFLLIGRTVNFSLEHGNSDASCHAYAMVGAILGQEFGNYEAGARFGRLGLELMEQRGLERFKARVYMAFVSYIIPWTQPIRTARRFVRGAFDAANKFGDPNVAVYSSASLNAILLESGDPLAEVLAEAEATLDFVRRAGSFVELITPQLQMVRTLRGLTPVFGCFNDSGFDEKGFERHLEEDERPASAPWWYWLRKLQARILANDHIAIVAAVANVERLLGDVPALFEQAAGHFYAALARVLLCDTASAAERTQHLELVAGHHRQLQAWREICPENFETYAALVGAEIARVEGRDADAMRLYELAIRSAHTNGFIHNEALANELAGRFYAARGFEKIARVYLQDARYGYLRWGAEGKVRQLDERYTELRQELPAPAPTDTIGAPVEHLDLATVMKVSQAISGEIVLERLLDTLMRTAIEQAGAERGLLVLARGAAPLIAAEATTSGDTIIVSPRDEAVTEAALPMSVLHYVWRAQEGVILDDAAAESRFSADPYMRQHSAGSVLCLPMLNQAKLIGVLYLENKLSPHVFAPARIAVLKLLASQAAVALENTRLYRDLEQREAKIRRLVEANVIGIFIFALDGRIVEANDAFLQMVGYDHEDLVSSRLRWTDLTPPEWRDRDALAVAEVKLTGGAQPYEKEYIRKDNSRVPVMIGVAMFEEGGEDGVAFVLDLAERKRAEAEARESERRYRETQMELAHMNRIATMGQLTASIAHEVNQPIAATIISAQAALRWLDARPPDQEKVRQALGRIVKDGNRAGEVIARIRGLIKKAPSQEEALVINQVILEVIALLRGEMTKHGISVQTQLADDLPPLQGDRVQLQQVILNLIVNAIQAMSSVSAGPRELLISTGQAEADSVFVAVRDSGPGLAPAAAERLFEPFYTTKPGGLGLGLSICRSIIEAHGGRLWANANMPGGAEFTFTISAHPGSAF